MYARLFDESEYGSFEVPPGNTNVVVIRKIVPGSPKLYVFQESKSACVLCSLTFFFFFVGNKFAADIFKDEILPSLK